MSREEQDTMSEPIDAVRKNAMQGIVSASRTVLICKGTETHHDWVQDDGLCGIGPRQCMLELAGGRKINSQDDAKRD